MLATFSKEMLDIVEVTNFSWTDFKRLFDAKYKTTNSIYL